MMTKTLFVPLMHISVSRLPVAYAKHPASVSLTLNIRVPELHMAGIKLGLKIQAWCLTWRGFIQCNKATG